MADLRKNNLFSAVRRYLSWVIRIFCLSCLLAGAGCWTPAASIEISPASAPDAPTLTHTPFQPSGLTATPTFSPPPTLAATTTRSARPGIFADRGVPDALKAGTILPDGWEWVGQAEHAQLRIAPGGVEAQWVYALVAPFPTVTDGINMQDLEQAWMGERLVQSGGQPLLLDETTLEGLKGLFGEPTQGAVQVTKSEDLLDQAWKTRAWAILPFENLDPRWKVISLDGTNPLSRGELKDYPLTAGFQLIGDPDAVGYFRSVHGQIPSTNRDPAHMTTLLMTGTSALVRAVGFKMEENGLEYPGRDIGDWLRNADFTHLSNESSFIPTCPFANPNQKSLMFCSRPEYIRLFESVGANIIELSGNHNNDWGRGAFSLSLDMFRQRGWRWFGGGENAELARQPLLIDHNDNHIALIGCNFAGPPTVWATADEPGAAHCNLDWLDGELSRLHKAGYLVVMTFQYNEIYQMKPSEGQARDFRRALEAGATIVSGSQAHFPQTYEIQSAGFIHYGLGNLFFDQMDTPVDGTRRELLDLHVFYGGRHISTVVYTAMLEDYARPRPMTAEERALFLADLFHASGW